jgi:hypothetical protein
MVTDLTNPFMVTGLFIISGQIAAVFMETDVAGR